MANSPEPEKKEEQEEQQQPNKTHPYTITLLTPHTATPTFLHALQQSTSHPSPAFLGADALFYNIKNPTGWGFSHIVLLEGDDAKLDAKKFRLRQHWSFTVESEAAYRGFGGDGEGDEGGDDVGRDVIRPDGGKKGEKAMGPEDLVELMKYFLPREFQGTRTYVLCFFAFKEEEGCEGELAYREHMEALCEGSEQDVHVHLQGTISNMGPFEHGTKFDSEKAHRFGLLSFRTEKGFGEYVSSRGYAKMLGRVRVSMVITRQMWLPPKSEPIDTSSWKYGNPYEPYGEDWFG
ncbi:hypothetical protein BU24DRAFT_427424 [Aaosphaeria arxii CBS 175.79]|uniref:Uncharacterized protein n=1 Tax=Aaosphaeria arxii CBS 175.79 TaxID=1450172 RepID=A0A6A5XBV9_9PLEO|nr:uncharacterized protein BU24DRAFT_427424 [Aaosphaeria arxii CBS 175.79]KAF2010297.1 hypothetical protein BU24DRAFT_427424 [Aaosphaeria arxii CBS 175.79]